MEQPIYRDYYAGVNDNGGGAIYTLDNTVLSFRGHNNFISNSASYGSGSGGGAICALKNAVYLDSMEPIILPVTQHITQVMVAVQSMLQITLHLASVELTSSSTIQQAMVVVVVQCTHQTIL